MAAPSSAAGAAPAAARAGAPSAASAAGGSPPPDTAFLPALAAGCAEDAGGAGGDTDSDAGGDRDRDVEHAGARIAGLLAGRSLADFPLDVHARAAARRGEARVLVLWLSRSAAASHRGGTGAALGTDPRHIADCARFCASPATAWPVVAPSRVVPVPCGSTEFWRLRERLAAGCNGGHDDYVARRIRAGRRPVVFALAAAERVENELLECRFELRRRALRAASPAAALARDGWTAADPPRIRSVLAHGLRRHPMRGGGGAALADDGGACPGGVEEGLCAAEYADYTLTQANGGVPLEPGQQTRVILLRVLPGRERRVHRLPSRLPPPSGYDSLAHAARREWFFSNESQLRPAYVLTVRAAEDPWHGAEHFYA